MPTMLAQEHMGLVEALQTRFGAPAMTQTTYQNAYFSLAGQPGTVLLTLSGAGVWTFSSSFTSPENVTTLIPAGGTVNLPAGVTWTALGPIVAFTNRWQTGLGTVVRSANPWVEVSALQAHDVTIQTISGNVPLAGGLLVINNASPARTVRLGTNLQTADLPGIQWSNNEALNQVWQMLMNTAGALVITRPGASPMAIVTNTGLGLGVGLTTPTHLLHLLTADAAQPGGGTWLNSSSDARVKEAVTPYEDGLALVEQLRPVWYTYNGLAETPKGARFVGLIADEVQAVAPYMVGSRPRKLAPDDAEETEVLNLNEAPILYALVRAVQELAQRVRTLEGAA